MRKKFFLAMMAGILSISGILGYAETNTRNTEATPADSTINSEATASDAKEDPETMLKDGVNQLAWDLYQEMNGQENLFFSPYSISAALSMLDLEADGETKVQLEKVLGIKDLEEWNRQIKAYREELNQEGAKAETANAMWLSNSLKLAEDAKEEVLEPLKEFYNSEIFQADMQKDTKKVLKEINTWVSDHTGGMIDPFLEDLPAGTLSMLVNAVYFDGTWTSPFEKERTRKDTFYGEQGETEVDMMSQSGTFRYVESDDYQAIQLPYGDGRMAMNILLPADSEKSLGEWYKGLGEDADAIWSNLNRAPETQMQVVRVPKFSLEYSMENLDQILKTLGITEAYSEQADFSRLAEGLQIDSIVHKAKLEVNEQHTKAAAATGIMVKATAAPVEDVQKFIANRPFIFVIQDTMTDMTLFMGQMVQPQ